MDLTIECNVELCKTECAPCSDPNQVNILFIGNIMFQVQDCGPFIFNAGESLTE